MTVVTVAVVTDSAANLPADAGRGLGIQTVPLRLHLGDRSFRDGVDLAPGDFYRRLREGTDAGSTATPGFSEFLSAFERTGEREIVCVTVASTMSGVHDQAVLAADRFEGRVEVVDSGGASMAEGFVVLEAARAAARGESLAAVAVRARAVAESSWFIAAVDTFEYLRRSGRVNALAAWAATMLDIKPVFSFHDGQARGLARPRTRRRALERVVSETLELIHGRPAHLAVVHAAAPAEAAELMRRLASSVDLLESFSVEATPVIGAHTGPGLLGAAFFCDPTEGGGHDTRTVSHRE